MDKRVYLLMIVSFVVGMVELIIGGILDLISIDLAVSLGQAGLLITLFSLVFAVSAPILLVVTAKVERKRLTLIALLIFLIGNIIAVVSPNYSILLLSRIVTATSGSLLVVLCITLASSIVEQKYIGRAIGIVSMGISGSLVLGVPIGLILGEIFGWRAPFALITVLTAFSMIGVHFFMKKTEPTRSIPLKQQIVTLKNRRIFFGHFTMFLYLSGHLTLYAYFKPFIQSTMGLSDSWISVIYLIFGIAAVTGGGIGGILADRFGTKPVILSVIISFGLAMFTLPFTTVALPLFLLVMVIWGMMNWCLAPALQSFLIEAEPKTASIQISLNNSALHFGIAFGSLIGGITIEQVSVTYNATIGGFIVILALGSAILAMTHKPIEMMNN